MADKQPKKEAPKTVFKFELEKDVSDIVNGFLNEERGNRVTINNMQGLMFAIQAGFNKNRIPANDRSGKKTETNTTA